MNNEWTDPNEAEGLDWDHGDSGEYPATNFDGLSRFLNDLHRDHFTHKEDGKQYLHKHTTTGNYAVYMQKSVEGFDLVGEIDTILTQNANLKETNEQLEFQLREWLNSL